jgi:DNA gyrase/topoisomerase IV subunit A
MTANIPPHHLGETLTATVNLIRNSDLIAVQKLQKELHSVDQQIAATEYKIEEVGVAELLDKKREALIEERKKIEESFLQLKRKINQELVNDLRGPDFPTGGYILEKEKLPSIYEKGEGTIYLRAKARILSSREIINRKEIEGTEKSARNIIWVTELPYKVSKSSLVTNISQIIKDKKIPGLKYIGDYSNRGIIDIRITFDAQQYDGQIILNKLYKNTQLQIGFAVKMRALMGDSPKIFSLMEVLQAFISNRLENIRRRSQFQ